VADRNGRFSQTNQALKWAKTGINEAKLLVYAKTGQITESADAEDISLGLHKLDAYREQLSRLLHNAENWTKSLLQTWNYQTNLVDSLNECDKVIQTFHHKQPGIDVQSDPEQKGDDIIAPSSPPHHNPNESHFGRILRGIANELYGDQQQSEKRYGHASNLLVVPLRNIINHEVMHAMDLQKRYILVKRQFDACCTNISSLKAKIEEAENPKEEEEVPDSGVAGTFDKLKMGFGKLMQSANPTVDELRDRLSVARSQLTDIIKTFDHSKMQFMEALVIVEEKMNVEVVYYVQQFLEFMRQCKSGSITPLKPQQQQQQPVDEEDSGNVLVEATRGLNEAQNADQNEFASVMMGNLDDINLSSPDSNNPTDDVAPQRIKDDQAAILSAE